MYISIWTKIARSEIFTIILMDLVVMGTTIQMNNSATSNIPETTSEEYFNRLKCNSNFVNLQNITMFIDEKYKLNITWLDSRDENLIRVGVKATLCGGHYEQFTLTHKKNVMIFPSADSNRELIENCVYEINYKVLDKFNSILCQEQRNYSIPDCHGITKYVDYLKDLTVVPFADSNSYIHFNITWKGYSAETYVDKVDIKIESVDEESKFGAQCKSLEQEYDYNITKGYIIKPLETLNHPQYDVTLGCNYTITIIENMNKCQRNIHGIYYKVPDCVGEVCWCHDRQDDIFISEMKMIDQFQYGILFKPNDLLKYNHTFQAVYYATEEQEKKNVTVIKDLAAENISVIVIFDELVAAENYTIDGIFIFDKCDFQTSFTWIVPRKSSSTIFYVGLTLILSILIISIILIKTIDLKKMKKYLPFLPQQRIQEFNMGKIRREINPLYFISDENNDNNFDRFEIPRTRIKIEKELDKGAFGKVYYGEAYGIESSSTYTKVAVKQLKSQPNSDEIRDFKAEIDFLKNLGEHPNIIKLLGCCTRDYPYLMIMELAWGSLRTYLKNVRTIWNNQKPNKFFFPDDMNLDDLGSYISTPQTPNVPAMAENSKLRIVKTANGNWSGCVTPAPITPRKRVNKPINIILEDNNDSDDRFFNLSPTQSVRSDEDNLLISNNSDILTPKSETSSRIPTTTETLLTNLDTPLLLDLNRTPQKFNHIEFSAPTAVLSHTELQKFALQIANGMEYLESMMVTHRDLAARNVLITCDKVLKISDFGMSKAGPYVSQSNKPMPLRWMAIEAIERAQCSNKSDVWSFGVVLWEIGTLGAFPYEKIDNNMLIHELKRGIRLERPKICTDEVYSVMQSCWSENPDDRPTFKELSEILNVKTKIYVDFGQLSPHYVFPPVEEVEVQNNCNNT